MTMSLAMGATRNEAPPDVSEGEAEALAARIFGIKGRVLPLTSERDHNFRIASGNGPSFVLKISHPAEDALVVDFQTSALLHVAQADPKLLVPRVIQAQDGAVAPVIRLASGHKRILRMFSWLDGLMLCDVPQSAAQDASMGQFLARLGLALADFSHRCRGDEGLVWDIRQAPRTAPLAATIEDPLRRKIVERAYETFERKTAQVLPQLRAQVIHNDMNPDNVLVGENDIDQVRGILDFGDMVQAPLVCDMAIGAAYRWPQARHPLEPAARFLKAYDGIRAIEDEEIALIPDLMRLRLAISVTLADWQAEQVPENRDYALHFNREFWQMLEALSALSHDDELRYLREYLERS